MSMIVLEKILINKELEESDIKSVFIAIKEEIMDHFNSYFNQSVMENLSNITKVIENNIKNNNRF